jgi:hypothetical protein
MIDLSIPDAARGLKGSLASQRDGRSPPGVRAHHWRFGDMPPDPAVTPVEVAQITRYVRELQQANGIESSGTVPGRRRSRGEEFSGEPRGYARAHRR